MRTVTLATCTLNQWAMDFDGNYKRILDSIVEAKQKGATYRCGPELEVTGYGCADHFYENDTFLHSWEVVAQIMTDERCRDIIIDIGLPVMHKNVSYNSRVIILNHKIILIRPKKKMCDNGIYRESRWFTGWAKDYCTEDFTLPSIIQNISGQITVPIGDAVICASDTCLGFEICEELWNPNSSFIKQCCSGVEITVNSSGGFHELGRTKDVVNVIKSATEKCGGIYLFSNLRGCDGDLVYYHGTSHITINGNISVMGEQFSLKDIEVVVATLDLDDVVSYRKSICKSHYQNTYPHIDVNYNLTSYSIPVTPLNSFTYSKDYEDGEEIALGPACWLWDYLRKSSYDGILLPVDGSVDSCSSAVIVYSMCTLIYKAIVEGNTSVLSDLQKILKVPNYIPSSSKELCNKILITCQFDSENTNNEVLVDSKDLSEQIGSKHFNVPIEKIVHCIINILFLTCGLIFSTKEKERMMNLQPKRESIKMIILYIFAEILSMNHNFPKKILILGVGNADKALLGNFVKYGCFSGDISLTGSISYQNLKQFLIYSRNYFKLTCLDKICVPECNEKFTFESVGNLEDINALCKIKKDNCGPYSVFCKLSSKCSDPQKLPEIAEKVKNFFRIYSLNYSKKFSVALCLHLGSYSIVNSYYDQHQILYNSEWIWQFSAIDKEIILNSVY